MTQYYARTDATYSGGDKFFSITFPYIKQEHINVFVNEEATNNYVYITSSQIRIDDELVNGDVVSIRRSTPIDARMVVFSDTSILDKQAQNLDSDQVFNVVQEMYDNNTIFQTGVNEDLYTQAQETEERLDAFIEEVTSDVDNIKSDLETIQQVQETTAEQLEYAEQLVDQAEFGMEWTSFTISNWSARQDGKYELILADLPLVNAVYTGTWDNKQLVCGVDVESTSNGCKLISLNAFNGYALSAASVLGKYVHTQDLPSDEWVIQHNLGHIPCITLLDANNIEMVGTIEHQSFNKCVITFTEPVEGRAYLR